MKEKLTAFLRSSKKQLRRLRLLSIQEKRAFSYIQNYGDKSDLRKVKSLIKTREASLELKRLGYTFMISSKDLLPHLKGKSKEIRILNKSIKESFLEERRKDFSERAWAFLPEYIAPNIACSKRTKQFLVLALFSDLKINLDDANARKLLAAARKIGKIASTSKKPDLVYRSRRPQLGKYATLINYMGKSVVPRKEDLEFIKKYILQAKKIKVSLPKDIKKCFKKKHEIALLRASARLELRKEVSKKDIERLQALSL